MLDKRFIKLKLSGKTKDEILEELVDILYEGGALENRDEFLKEIKEREKISSTGLEDGIAIPHGKSKAVKKATVAFGRIDDGIDFDSLDGEPTKLVFMIAAPEDATDSHIEMLSKITGKLLNDDLRRKLELAENEEEVLKLLNDDSLEKKKVASIKRDGFIVAVTACPVGIAHTYMAADSLINKATELGVEIKVETNGSVGVKNEITEEDIKRATGVIVAADKSIDMDRFAGKKIIQVSVKEAIRAPKDLIEKALSGDGILFKGSEGSSKENVKSEKTGIYKHLMNGVSHMLPLVVCGGVLIALAIALSGIKAGSGADVTNPFFKAMLDLGAAAFGLMIPILAGYIAVSIADRPGLAPGLVGGALANAVGAGFLGGMIAGFAAGYIAKWVKSWNVPNGLKPIMPIFVIPLVSTCLVGVLMYFIGAPISGFMVLLTDVLKGMQEGSIFLALILGFMIAFDMGGPINKVAFLFGSAMITQGVPTVMGPIAVAICIPPIGMGIATMMAPKNYEVGEREAGKAAFAMGLIGITEGAIPFAAADPIRVIPSIMIGSGVGAVIAAIGKVADHAPHGGPIVLPVVDNKLMFVIAILVGSLVCAILVNILKKMKKN